MSREIKFRAWDKENSDWVDYSSQGNLIDTALAFPETIVLMQFTGLHDHNGKDLYHTDLIVNQSRNNGKPHIVEWSNRYGAWVGKYREMEYLIAPEQHEINYCGTFYENTELLEAQA